ncbi:MAG: HEAT repeat domain-containing protein [Candidatus Sericytochromatia bacterium]|nr:HEAT repeat domain-containing protein [Candidatus Sericytochromatia bacterium]
MTRRGGGEPREVLARLADQHEEEAFGAAARRLVEEAPEQAIALLPGFAGLRRGIGRAAVHALTWLGPAAGAPLREVLAHGGPLARTHAAWALGSVPGPETREALLQTLEHGDAPEALQRACLASLGELADPQAVPRLMAASRGWQAAALRAAVARTLGLCGDEAAVGFLAPWLTDAAPGVRLQVAEALVRLTDTRGWPVLFALLRGDHAPSREAADALRALGDLSSSAPLLLGGGDDGYTTRRDAAEALGALGDPRALGPLLEARLDPNPWVRGAVAYALGRIGEPRVAPSLVLMLGDASDWVKICAARALGLLGEPSARRPLARLMEAANVEVAAAAREAHAAIGP